MSDTVSAAAVHTLRPRKVSISEQVDHFLEEQGFHQANGTKLVGEKGTNSGNMNRIECRSCGQIEYLSRADCRCGHYLRGQLEDEYLLRADQLNADHQELSALIEVRLKPLRYLSAFGTVLLLVPLLQLTFWSEQFSLEPLVWLVPALLIGGFVSIAEKFLSQPIVASTRHVENYTFEAFLEDRSTCQMETTIC
tara:strand:+ start:154 stop:735 length:582 start_codon:yes stop_codon:yes gene_type:complete